MARRIPAHLAPNQLRRPIVTVRATVLESETFPTVDAPDLPRDQLPEIPAALLALPVAVDHDRATDARGAEEKADHDQEHGPGDELDGAEGDAHQVEDHEQPGEDVEHDGDHAGTVPVQRPFNLAQLKEGLTLWVDGLTDFDDQAVGLHQVQEAAGALGEARGELVDRLVDGLPVNDRGHRVPWVETPVGILKKDRSGGYSSWDAELIWPDLLAEARRRCADPETGELTPEAERGAQAMLMVLKEVISSPSFRVRALEKLGIDPDQVRATTPSRTIVRFA